MDKTIHIRIPEDLYKILEKEADQSNRKISSMVRHILIQWARGTSQTISQQDVPDDPQADNEGWRYLGT